MPNEMKPAADKILHNPSASESTQTNGDLERQAAIEAEAKALGRQAVRGMRAWITAG